MDGDPLERAAPPRAEGRIVGLDGLRAVSILLVLLAHGSAALPADSPLRPFAPYFGNGSLGVMTFFVISGYLITYLLRKEWQKTGTLGLPAFYMRRVLRIFPALYAYLLTIAALRAAGLIETTYPDIAAAGTFLTNYKHFFALPTNDDYWFVGHFWTLSLEEQFYLFWPATILAAGLRNAPCVAVGIVLAAPLLRVVSYALWPGVRGQIEIMLHTASDPLMVGCLAALWEGSPKLEKALGRLSHVAWPLAAALFLFAASPWLAVRFRGAYTITVGTTLNALSVAFLLAWVVRHPASVLTRCLANPAVRHVGVLSYSLYLWQQLFLTPKNLTWAGTFPLNFVACFAAAELSYWVVESPFLRLRGRFRPAEAPPPRAVPQGSGGAA